MLKKILYGIIGIVGFFILIAIIVPTPEPNTNQENKDSVAIENTNIVTAAAEPAIDTQTIPQVAEEKTAQPETQSSAPAGTADTQDEYYSVSSIVDGDTIKINVSGTVQTFRLIGMDTPETVDPRKSVQCFGEEASNKAKELLTGKKVRIEKDSTQGDLDKYGRHLAYIYREDGLFYNKYMIEQGYAHEYTYDTPYKYQSEFKAAQKSAQENLRGLWSPDTCNGDTTSSVATPTPTPSETNTTNSPTVQYYTSSYHTAKYYYPAACSGWKGLSQTYLKVFDSLEALLAAYPSRTLSPQCQ